MGWSIGITAEEDEGGHWKAKEGGGQGNMNFSHERATWLWCVELETGRENAQVQNEAAGVLFSSWNGGQGLKLVLGLQLVMDGPCTTGAASAAFLPVNHHAQLR